MKHNYLVPSIKVVAFKVEDVFTSPLNVGDQTPTDDFPDGIAGTQSFGDGGIFTTVFGD